MTSSKRKLVVYYRYWVGVRELNCRTSIQNNGYCKVAHICAIGSYIKFNCRTRRTLPVAESGRPCRLVVVQVGTQKAGLVVDRLFGELQTVIKPLGKLFKQLSAIRGSTILGSGEVAIILDVPTLIHRAVGEQHTAVNQYLLQQTDSEQDAQLH